MLSLLKDVEGIDLHQLVTYYIDATHRGLSLEEAIHMDAMERAAEIVAKNIKPLKIIA